MENCKFTDENIPIINNCIQKCLEGIRSIMSIRPTKNPCPIDHDNFISFRIGLAFDAANMIDTTIDRIKYGVEGIKTYNNFMLLNSIYVPSVILMRSILRRMEDLSFLWKHPINTVDYREHQINGESGEWAYNRLGLSKKKKTEQGIIVVINEIFGISLTNNDFKKKSDYFNDNYYGKYAIERYMLLHNSPLDNEDIIRRTKGDIMQCIIDCYEYIELIIKGFEKYEQVIIDNTDALDAATDITDILIIRQIRKQYQYEK